jgi:hypothetical protein
VAAARDPGYHHGCSIAARRDRGEAVSFGEAMAETQKPPRGSAPAGASDTPSDSGGARAGTAAAAAAEPKDEVDPELLSLRGPRPRVGLLLSLSIVLLCAYLMIRILPDLRFALADAEPEMLPAPADALAIGPERHVAIEGLVLDRAAALRISHSADPEIVTGHRVAPALGTGGALWVATPGIPRLAPLRHDETHVGRLRALGDVPFAEALITHARERGAPRYATTEALREALASGADEVLAPGGERLPVTADTRVSVAELVANEAEITAVATDEHPSAERWAQALFDAGALPGLRPPVAEGEDLWVFETEGRAEDITAALAEARLFGADAQQVKRVHEAALGELEWRGATLVAGDASIPWSDIEAVWLEVTVPVAEGAMLLLAGEHPRDFRHALLLFALLGAFALLFVAAFADGLRRELRAKPARPVPEKSATQSDR